MSFFWFFIFCWCDAMNAIEWMRLNECDAMNAIGWMWCEWPNVVTGTKRTKPKSTQKYQNWRLTLDFIYFTRFWSIWKMESLAAKLLKKYLNFFFKNLSKENIFVSMTEGRGELKNLGMCFFGLITFVFIYFQFFLELNEVAIQDLLYIPTNLLVTRSFCNHVYIQVIQFDE